MAREPAPCPRTGNGPVIALAAAERQQHPDALVYVLRWTDVTWQPSGPPGSRQTMVTGPCMVLIGANSGEHLGTMFMSARPG